MTASSAWVHMILKAASVGEVVKALFEHIEAEVKPVVQPLYTTTCPRGHEGRWIDLTTGEEANIDPLDLSPDERRRHQWEGPEVIYTFWAKHGPCQARGCGHRTPVFRSPVVAEKKLSTAHIPTTCPSCGQSFGIELEDDVRQAARLAGDLVRHWRDRPAVEAQVKQMTLFDQLEAEGA